MSRCLSYSLNSLLMAFVVAFFMPANAAWSADEAEHTTADHTTAHSHSQEGTHGEHDDDSHDEHAEGHGPPNFWEDLSFWGFIAFIGFCFAINKLGLWDSLTTNMASREQNEQSLIDNAEAHLANAKSSLNSYRGQLEAMDETIKEILAEADRDANHTHSEIIELANKEAKSSLQRAEHQIHMVRDQSLLDIFTSMADQVAHATETAVREKLNSEDQDRLIDETLNQLTHS